MNQARRSVVAAVLLLASWPAAASDLHGVLTLVVGIPVLVVASVLLAIMLPFRSRKTARFITAFLFIPTLGYSLYVAFDAVTLFREIGSENSMIGLAFFGLLARAVRSKIIRINQGTISCQSKFFSQSRRSCC